MTTDRDRFEELAALCAAGAATAVEQRALDALILADPIAMAEYREFCEAGALLAEALPRESPPAQVLDPVRHSIQTTSSRGGPQSPPGPGHKSPAEVIDLASRRLRRSAVMTTASVVATAAMALLWLRERDHNSELREKLAIESQLREAQVARERTRNAQLTGELHKASRHVENLSKWVDFVQTPQLSLATLSGDDGPTVKIFIDPEKRRWLVFAYELPSIPEDRDYQLWFISQQEGPVPAGVLQRRPDRTLEAEITIPADLFDIQQAAISIEKKGGAEEPTLDQIKIIGPL